MKYILTDFEYKIAVAIAQGMRAREITEWYGLQYKDYVNCKRRILRKLKIKRMTEIFSKLFEYKF